MIPTKYKNNCPLDHSTYQKFVECDCNYGTSQAVWWFKEQQIEKLQADNQTMKEALESIAKERIEITPTVCALKALEALKKAGEK